MIKSSVLVIVLAAAATIARADSIPQTFAGDEPDRTAIQAVLDTYTRAVSTKNEALFESQLLNLDIPFSGVDQAVTTGPHQGKTENFESFRQDVFHGPAFIQRFQDIHIQEDGRLAQVSLTFINTDKHGSNWGWKTLQLLKIGSDWKIASEFWTNHAE